MKCLHNCKVSKHFIYINIFGGEYLGNLFYYREKNSSREVKSLKKITKFHTRTHGVGRGGRRRERKACLRNETLNSPEFNI